MYVVDYGIFHDRNSAEEKFTGGHMYSTSKTSVVRGEKQARRIAFLALTLSGSAKRERECC